MALKHINLNLHFIILLGAISSLVLIISTTDTRLYVSPETTQGVIVQNISLWPEGNKLFVFGYEENKPLFEIENLYTNIAEGTARFLGTSKLPNTFYYVWCGKRQFTFQHYLSVLSVIRYMRPDTIVFYYKTLPLSDDEAFYNTWFEELRKNVPFISTVELDAKVTCTVKKKPYLLLVDKILKDSGGLYITEGTILTKVLDLNDTLLFKWDNDLEEGFLQAAPGMSSNEVLPISARCPNVTIQTSGVSSNIPKSSLEKITTDVCMRIDGAYYPRDFWTRPDHLGDLIRNIMYGTPEIRKPFKHSHMVIPNIAHMVWIGGGQMEFIFYLSVLSLVYIQKVEAVFIHGETPPSGEYWDNLQDIPQIIFRGRSVDNLQVYGKTFDDTGQSHRLQSSHNIMRDIIRSDVMLRWGGMYFDTEAFIVKKFNEDIMRYDTVTQYSFHRRFPYPDTLVPGLILARPGSGYFVRYQEALKRSTNEQWMYDSLLTPYKIMERYPYLVHIDPRIQVECLYGKCHPTWVAGFKNSSQNHLNTGSLPNWRGDANVFHFCLNSTPKELMNFTALNEAPSASIFAQMGKYILQKAGKNMKS